MTSVGDQFLAAGTEQELLDAMRRMERESAERPGSVAGTPYIYNHLRFVIKFHKEDSFVGSRVLRRRQQRLPRAEGPGMMAAPPRQPAHAQALRGASPVARAAPDGRGEAPHTGCRV